MAGASTTSPKLGIAISKEDAPSSSEFEQIKNDIYKRTLERNPELKNKNGSATAYLKWLADLQETFYPAFSHQNLSGHEFGKDKKLTYSADKDKFVDFAYVAFTRMADPKKEEDGTHTFRTDNGSIKTKSGKIEFVAGFEPVEEGKKPKKKEFSLEDAYNVVLLAMQDRTMMPPNKMKFHGTKKERAMLWHAAQHINADLPRNQKFNVGAEPKSAIPFVSLFSKKDDPFDRIFMDIRDNAANPNGWSIREKEAAQKAEETRKATQAAKGQSQQNTNTPKDKGNDNGPENGGPAPTPSNGRSGGETFVSDEDNTPDEPAGITGDEPAASPANDPAVKAAEVSASTSEPKDDLLTKILAGESVSMAFGEQKLNGNHSGFTEAIVADFNAPAPDVEPEPIEESPIVDQKQVAAEEPATVDLQQQDAAAESALDHLENIYNNVRNYIVHHEDALRGQSAYYEIKSLLEIMPPGNLATHDNLNNFAKAMEIEGIIIRDKKTGEPVLRGLAQFTPRDPDYNEIAMVFVRRGKAYIGQTPDSLAEALEDGIQKDNRHETKGFGHQLSPLLRKDIASGMAQRIMTQLQEDNVIQMKNGKVSHVASGFSGNLNLQQNFGNAAAPSEVRQPSQPAVQTQSAPQTQPPEPHSEVVATQAPAAPVATAPSELHTDRNDDIEYDKAATASIEGAADSTTRVAPELSDLDVLRERLDIRSAYDQPVRDEDVPLIDQALGEPDFAAHADIDSTRLEDDIAAVIMKELGPIAEGAHKPTLQEAGFTPVKASQSLSAEDFPVAAALAPEKAPQNADHDAAELARLTRELSEIILDHEKSGNAEITDEMIRKNPLQHAEPRMAAQ